MKMRTRITLTKQEAESPTGARLIEMILAMCHDGELTIGEIEQLHMYLRQDESSVAAVIFLRAITREIVADGSVDGAEAYRLKAAFERVVPKAVRGVVSSHLERIGLPAVDPDDAPAWTRHAATARQIEYIQALGGKVASSMTKGEASYLIEELVEQRPPTARQLMLLRFFDRLDLATETKDEVSRWIDQLYSDEQMERAWSRFKHETDHDPHSLDSDIVPVGAFRQYLAIGSGASSLGGLWRWLRRLFG